MKPLNHDDWELLVRSRFPQDGRDVFSDEEARQDHLRMLVRSLMAESGMDAHDAVMESISRSRGRVRRSMCG